MTVESANRSTRLGSQEAARPEAFRPGLTAPLGSASRVDPVATLDVFDVSLFDRSLFEVLVVQPRERDDRPHDHQEDTESRAHFVLLHG